MGLAILIDVFAKGLAVIFALVLGEDLAFSESFFFAEELVSVASLVFVRGLSFVAGLTAVFVLVLGKALTCELTGLIFLLAFDIGFTDGFFALAELPTSLLAFNFLSLVGCLIDLALVLVRDAKTGFSIFGLFATLGCTPSFFLDFAVILAIGIAKQRAPTNQF